MSGDLSTFEYPRIDTVRHVDLCNSTQLWAKQLAVRHQELPDASLFIAEEQVRAQGRQDRSWYSPPGGLWWSLLLKPAITPEQSQALSAAAALGVLQGIEQATGATVRLKWPNDILLNNKKLAGILTETSLRGDSLEWVIVGVGINVNNPLSPELVPTATSLSLWKGEELDLDMVLKSVLDGFFDVYDRFLKGGFESIKPLYLGKLDGLGSVIKVEAENQVYQGVARDVDPQGRLVVELNQGILRPFSSSEAHLV